MKISAITLFSPLNWPFDLKAIHSASRFLMFAKQHIEAAGYPVQTLRMATPPFMDLVGDPDPTALGQFATTLERHTRRSGIEHTSIGPVIATTPRSLLAPIYAIPNIIKTTDTIFCSALVASSDTGINLAAIKATAQAIYQIGQETPQGIGNTRFGMLANVGPRNPVFPGAYHNRSTSAFGIAVDATDVAVTVMREAQSLERTQASLIQALNTVAEPLLDTISDLIDEHNISFSGIDLSLNAHPKDDSSDDSSIETAIEYLGSNLFGSQGTTFAISFLSNAIKQTNLPLSGFSGVMLPRLKDNGLAQRITETPHTANDLLLYAVTGGIGLDAVPIPGGTSPEQIASLLLDVATLSTVLNKPFMAQLIPVPGLQVGDTTNFEDGHFSNTTVLPLKVGNTPAIFNKNIFFNF